MKIYYTEVFRVAPRHVQLFTISLNTALDNNFAPKHRFYLALINNIASNNWYWPIVALSVALCLFIGKCFPIKRYYDLFVALSNNSATYNWLHGQLFRALNTALNTWKVLRQSIVFYFALINHVASYNWQWPIITLSFAFCLIIGKYFPIKRYRNLFVALGNNFASQTWHWVILAPYTCSVPVLLNKCCTYFPVDFQPWY